MTTLSPYLAIVGLLLDLAGAVVLVSGLFISKKQAIALSVARFAAETDEGNLRQPAVQDRLRQSRRAILGLILLIFGFGLQIASYWSPRSLPSMSLNQLVGFLDSLSVLALVGITAWYAVSTAKMKKEMFRQSRITAVGAEMAARAALAQIAMEEGKSKRRLDELTAELEELTEDG